MLAAGGSKRYKGDTNKLLVPFKGKPLVSWAVEAALQAGLDETVVVSGAVDLSHLLPYDVTLLRNDSWERGMASSLAGALHWCEFREHQAVVVGLADQPLIPASAWIKVASAGSSASVPIVVATYAGRRRNPVFLDKSVWPLLPSSGDVGARDLMAKRPELVAEVACNGSPLDVDTEEDIRRLRQQRYLLDRL